MRAVLVHEHFIKIGGSERVVQSILNSISVEAIFTLMDFLQGDDRLFLKDVPINKSFLQHMPLAKSKYRYFLPIMPLAIESFDLSFADMIISSSHAVAKGVITNSEQLHICYCYSPMRYAWDLMHQYLSKEKLESGVKSLITKIVLNYLRLWDLSTVNRVDYFIAISHYIRRRIWKVYRRASAVIYPPVDIDKFDPKSSKEGFYLVVSRLVPYKNIDIIVEAFAQADRKLIVVGDGPELNKIKNLATPNIEILGYQPRPVVQDLMQKAKAFVFAGDEDFGIVNIEAQAAGTPVIAYARGGSLETVHGCAPGIVPGREATGVFFPDQSSASLLEAVDWFERYQEKFDPLACRQNAERFSRPRFEREFRNFVESKWALFEANRQKRLH